MPEIERSQRRGRAETRGEDAPPAKKRAKQGTERGREDVAQTRQAGRGGSAVAPKIVQGLYDARMAGRLARAVSLVRDGKPLVRALSLARREVHAISYVCVSMCTCVSVCVCVCA
jgi:hypothetical protein